jgi:hypothetical protein
VNPSTINRFPTVLLSLSEIIFRYSAELYQSSAAVREENSMITNRGCGKNPQREAFRELQLYFETAELRPFRLGERIFLKSFAPGQFRTRLRNADGRQECQLIGKDWKRPTPGQNGAFEPKETCR